MTWKASTWMAAMAAACLLGAPAAAGDGPGSCRVAAEQGNRVACADGSPGKCRCLRLVNGCPYEVVVYALVDGSRRTVPLAASATDEGSACSGPSREDATGIGWHPADGLPAPGQPVPSP